MKSRRKPGDIVEFEDHTKRQIVDRIDSVHISTKYGTQYFMEQYEDYRLDSHMYRVLESLDTPQCETWPSKWRSGQVVVYKYNGKEEYCEIDEVDWRFSRTEKYISYWLKNSHMLQEKEIICEWVTPSTNSDQKSYVPPLSGSKTNAAPAGERGPRLVKSTE